MIVPRLADAKRALTPHHILNAILSLAFIVAKTQPFICENLFIYEGECGVDSREREILMFLAVIIVWKGRKATNWLHYISNVFLFAKVANVFLFLRADPLIGIVYVVVALIVSVIFPEPLYVGPERITYFQGPELFDELTKDRKTTWFIMFYTTWSPDCKHVNPVFAQLSDKFTLPNLRFGKLDVGRWPKEAERFRVNAHPMSRQLPTVCCFQENSILEFDMLNINIYNECKSGMNKSERKQFSQEQTAKEETKKDQ